MDHKHSNLISFKNLVKCFVTPCLLQKGVSENFNFHVTLRHHQSYKLAAEYIYIYIYFNDNTSELLTKILQNREKNVTE
jgi:hypothetical protein